MHEEFVNIVKHPTIERCVSSHSQDTMEFKVSFNCNALAELLVKFQLDDDVLKCFEAEEICTQLNNISSIKQGTTLQTRQNL